MKKFAVLFVLVAGVVGSVAISSATANGDPTIVQQATGFSCGTFNADGSINITTASVDSVFVNGKEVLHCIGQDPSGGDGTVHKFTGFLCGLFFGGLSSDPLNNDRVSKSGESQLWCYGHGGGAPSSTVGAQ
jgi:hypothetical protein